MAEAVTAAEATEAVVMMVVEEIEAEARAEAVMVVAAMAEEATAEAVKVVEKAVAKEAVVMMAAETVAAREAEEMAVEMEAAAREEASAAVIWEVGNQEGHSNGHSSLQRGSSPSSACAMMQRRCAPVVRFLVEKPRALCNPMNRHGAKEVHRHMKPHTVHVNSKGYMYVHELSTSAELRSSSRGAHVNFVSSSGSAL